MTDGMKFHEYANIFPLLEGAEFDSLVEDIKANGLLDTIWLHADGRILDGRNRYLACKEAGVKPRYQTWKGSDDNLLQFVISRNIKRRNMSESQRALLAAELSNVSHGGDRSKVQICTLKIDEASVMLNTSVRSIKTGNKLLKDGADELIEAVRKDIVSISAAAELAELPKETQREIVIDYDKKGILKKAGQMKKANKKAREKEREHRRNTLPVDFPPITERYQLYQEDVSNLESVPDESVDWIITDPPYQEEFIPLYKALSKTAARVLKPEGSLICMCGQSYLLDIMRQLSGYLKYNWTCDIQTPGPATQIFQRRVNTTWKPVLWYTKEVYEGEWISPDVFKSDGSDKSLHDWGQSLSGMRDIVNRFVSAGDTVLDPFLGAGTTAIAALEANCKFIGSDIDKSSIKTTMLRICELELANQCHEDSNQTNTAA